MCILTLSTRYNSKVFALIIIFEGAKQLATWGRGFAEKNIPASFCFERTFKCLNFVICECKLAFLFILFPCPREIISRVCILQVHMAKGNFILNETSVTPNLWPPQECSSKEPKLHVDVGYFADMTNMSTWYTVYLIEIQNDGRPLSFKTISKWYHCYRSFRLARLAAGLPAAHLANLLDI